MFSALNTTKFVSSIEYATINIFVTLMLGIMSCLIIAEILSDYMLFNIEKAKKEKDKEKETELKRKEEIDALVKEIIKLQEDIHVLNTEVQELKKDKEPIIIQCDKCFNEYCETEIKTCHIIGHIFQQYCIDCMNKGYKLE